jgi:hypothetical protein
MDTGNISRDRKKQDRVVEIRSILDKRGSFGWLFIQVIMLCTGAAIGIFMDYASTEGSEFSIKPSIMLRQEFDDNIFLENDNKTSDYITRVLPSVNMRYNAPFWEWTLDYTLNWWRYWDLKETDYSNTANLASKMKLIQNFLYLDINDVYSSVVINPRRPSTETNLQQNRTDTNNLSVSPTLRYHITSTVVFTGGYRYTNIWYREEGSVNRQLHTGFGYVDYLVNPRLTASVGAEYTADRPAGDEPSNDQSVVYFRMQYKFGPRLDADIAIGYRQIKYDDGRNDDVGLSYNGTINYHLPETGNVEIRASSVITPSPTLGEIESRTGQITVRYGEAFSVNGSFFYRKEKYLEEDRQDNIYGGTAGIEYRPDQRMTLRVGVGIEKDKYLPQNNRRDIYAAFTGIDYRITAKATLGVTYNYSKSSGDVTSDNYSDNLVGLQFRMEI